MSVRPYRYQLPKKALKGTCPDCGHKHRNTLSRYIDTQTGEPLPEIYGRCDRESNCSYSLSPYTKGPSGLSYADEVFQQWKEEQQRMSPYTRPAVVSAIYPKPFHVFKPTPAVAAEPLHFIPDEVVKKSLGHYEQNQFAKLLRAHFGLSVADSLLQRFHIGTSKSWQGAGACVFWMIDLKGRACGGQVKLFDDTFHTVKYLNREGKPRSRTSWAHSILAYGYEQQQLDKPEWLVNYIEQGEFASCLFGLPQLEHEPISKPIAVVESPKTAVLATPYFPQFAWVAVMGRSYLNAERLAPIKHRSIVLFPDLSKDGKDYQYWKQKADDLREEGFNVVISDWLEKLASDTEREKGFDLADYLLEEWHGYPPSWDDTG